MEAAFAFLKITGLLAVVAVIAVVAVVALGNFLNRCFPRNIGEMAGVPVQPDKKTVGWQVWFAGDWYEC